MDAGLAVKSHGHEVPEILGIIGDFLHLEPGYAIATFDVHYQSRKPKLRRTWFSRALVAIPDDLIHLPRHTVHTSPATLGQTVLRQAGPGVSAIVAPPKRVWDQEGGVEWKHPKLHKLKR